MAGPYYPTDAVDRDDLAAALEAAGYVPTQRKGRFRRDDLEAMCADMAGGQFDWVKAARFPVILGPGGEVIDGHHRVVAAHLAGLDLDIMPGLQVRRVPQNFRPVYEWIDELPDV